LDALSVIRSDPFVLISGDVISNINLKEAIAFHKRKRKEDINNVMTLVLKEVQRTAGAKPLLDDLVVAMDRSTSQIVLFENSYKKGSVKVSLELMEDHPKGLNFYTDLLDCNVDICSPELMLQFSDNFDYQVCGAYIHTINVPPYHFIRLTLNDINRIFARTLSATKWATGPSASTFSATESRYNAAICLRPVLLLIMQNVLIPSFLITYN